MPGKTILAPTQRGALFDPPTDPSSMNGSTRWAVKSWRRSFGGGGQPTGWASLSNFAICVSRGEPFALVRHRPCRCWRYSLNRSPGPSAILTSMLIDRRRCGNMAPKPKRGCACAHSWFQIGVQCMKSPSMCLHRPIGVKRSLPQWCRPCATTTSPCRPTICLNVSPW